MLVFPMEADWSMPIPPFDATSGYLQPAAALYAASEAEIEVAFGSTDRQKDPTGCVEIIL